MQTWNEWMKVHLNEGIYICECLYECIYEWMYVYVYENLYMNECISECIYVYSCAFICICECMH